MVEYSVVIPAYNEEAVITRSLTQVLNFMHNFAESFEIIVVDDGSSDETVPLVTEYKKLHQEISLIENPHKGKGFAVRTGVLSSQGDYVLIADADMATPIDELKRLSVWVKENNIDVAIASREGVGAKRINEPWIRHFMGRVFNLIVKIIVLPGIEDTQCGFKLFKKPVAKDIFTNLVLFGDNVPEIKVPRVTAFDVEVLVIAKRRGYSIKEVPISWTHGSGSKVNPVRDSINNFLDVLKVKIMDLKGKYKK